MFRVNPTLLLSMGYQYVYMWSELFKFSFTTFRHSVKQLKVNFPESKIILYFVSLRSYFRNYKFRVWIYSVFVHEDKFFSSNLTSFSDFGQKQVLVRRIWDWNSQFQPLVFSHLKSRRMTLLRRDRDEFKKVISVTKHGWMSSIVKQRCGQECPQRDGRRGGSLWRCYWYWSVRSARGWYHCEGR